MESPFPLLIAATGLMIVPFLVVSLTAFVKIAVVLFLVRSALGVQQTPPNLVLYGVTIVLTSYVMSPVLAESFAAMTNNGNMTALPDPTEWPGMLQRGLEPVREFLLRFTTDEDRAFFLSAAEEMHADTTVTPSDSDIFILAPAFVTAELTRAFEIGVLLYLPFIVVDLVITNILTAMGMMMVSPTLISLPFKVLLFVAVDGWTRLTHGLVMSYVPGA
ncbi:type III secretion system export apparatus subunit SctR [Paracoccus sediminicola]|uniref:type III secretion system export apparatus subunit SctR n=1 Tax=Paracoccus sediminicola TaxID=3017783 RepID=UPI0022F0FE82|nr:type III secretion system export apparatus subunit SctR [Paracoccus sediminicola]WBU57186.1 type III secretion system export apparatus subunit SctR [Paracoccus sediminicola]